MTFWDFFLLLMWGYLLMAYLMVLFQICADLFRDHELAGLAKALWVLALIVLPLLSAVVYVIVRGRGMAERRDGVDERAGTTHDHYARYVANTPSSADQIASAKALRDEGTITQGEFEGLKAKALAA